MRKRESEKIEKLFNSENEIDTKKAIAACRKFGNCPIFGKNEKCKKCGNCEEKDTILHTICGIVGKQNVKKSRSERPWDLIVFDLYKGVPRKEITKKCIELGMTESAAKDFVSSAGCVVNTVKGKNRKKDGLVAQYIAYLKKGRKGQEPTGSKNLVYYCKTVWSVCMKNEDIAGDILAK